MTNTAPTGGVIVEKHDKNKRTEREKTRTWLIVGAEKRQEAVSCITSGLVTAFVRFLSRANLHRQPQMDHPHLRHLMPEPVCRCACERGRLWLWSMFYMRYIRVFERVCTPLCSWCVCVDRSLFVVRPHVMCVWRMMCAHKMHVLQCEGVILD